MIFYKMILHPLCSSTDPLIILSKWKIFLILGDHRISTHNKNLSTDSFMHIFFLQQTNNRGKCLAVNDKIEKRENIFETIFFNNVSFCLL